MRNSKTIKNERLEARITPMQKRLIERAANLRGKSLTDFVLSSAQEAAAQTIKDFESLTLGAEAQEAFVNAILHPAKPTKSARESALRYKRHMGI